jgi:acetyl-CoA acetyltransferase
MKTPVVISAVRTPVGRYMGALKDVEPYDLAALVLGEVIKRAGLSAEQVDEVIMAQLNIEQIDLIEVQEAFAAQVLADLIIMGVIPEDYGKVNVNGSGISLGHPVAATGTRVLATTLHEMKRSKARYGLECICGGGGLGIAAVFERND